MQILFYWKDTTIALKTWTSELDKMRTQVRIAFNGSKMTQKKGENGGRNTAKVLENILMQLDLIIAKNLGWRQYKYRKSGQTSWDLAFKIFN